MIHYPMPPHLQKAYDYLGHKEGDFPIAEEIANTCLSLPSWPGMKKSDVEYVASVILNFYAKDPKFPFLFKNRVDSKEEINYEIVKLKLNVANQFTIYDINIESADNITFDTDNTAQNLYINKKNNNYHYISYNSSINVSQYNNTSIINFDLVRSKFNLTLKNVFIKNFLPPDPIPHNPNIWQSSTIKIPSEFIDISIANIDDYGYNVFINNAAGYIHNYNFNFGNNIFSIKSFSVSYFIHDLITILYSQNMCPWINNKYEKRIFRLLFLYTLRGNTLPHLITLLSNNSKSL